MSRRSYPAEFRAEVVAAIQRGMSIAQAQRVFDVADATVKKWAEDAAAADPSPLETFLRTATRLEALESRVEALEHQHRDTTAQPEQVTNPPPTPSSGVPAEVIVQAALAARRLADSLSCLVGSGMDATLRDQMLLPMAGSWAHGVHSGSQDVSVQDCTLPRPSLTMSRGSPVPQASRNGHPNGTAQAVLYVPG